MTAECEDALARYDAAHREVNELYQEMLAWAAAAGLSATAVLGALAAAVALVATGTAEAATVIGLPIAVVQAIAAILVTLVGLLASIALLASFIGLVWTYILWGRAKDARAQAMADIREHCPRSDWPPVP